MTTFNPAVAADGQCSLIEALVNANDDAPTHGDCAAGSGPDTIELPAGTYTLTLVYDGGSGGTGLPIVTGTITINGHGAVVTRSSAPLTPLFRIMRVAAGGNLTLNDLTASNGAVSSSNSGGGALNNGTLTCNNCILEDNTALAGGGIYNFGGATLVLNNSTLRNNLADGNVGGAIYNRDSNVTLSNSVVHDNTSSGYAIGGGILSWASWTATTTTTLTVSHSQIMNNTAAGDGSTGGGISNIAVSGKSAILMMTDSTVTGNQAQFGAGIGFYDHRWPGSQLAWLHHPQHHQQQPCRRCKRGQCGWRRYRRDLQHGHRCQQHHQRQYGRAGRIQRRRRRLGRRLCGLSGRRRAPHQQHGREQLRSQ